MGLVKRGKTYWIRIQHNGKRVQQSLETDNRRLAEKRYAKVITDLEEGRYFDTIKAKRITFKEMADKYLNRHEKLRDRRTLKTLLPVFGNLTLSEITTELVSDYQDERLRKVKPATLYKELALMRRMFNVARREWKWLNNNPVADLSFSVGNNNARDRWLTKDNELKLLEIADPEWVREIVLFALHTGMRRGEILNLNWKDIDMFRRIVTVHKSKNGGKRSIPMSSTLYDLLNRKQRVRSILGHVFPINEHTLRSGFERAIRNAGIQDFTFHDLRHTFATRLIQNGVDLYKVKELLGHKTILMTMRYAHHYPESLRSSVEVLDKWYNSGTIANYEVDKNLLKPVEFSMPEWRNLVDARDLKSLGRFDRTGSSPVSGTKNPLNIKES